MKLLQLMVIFSVSFGLAFKSKANSPAAQVSIVADPSAGAPVRHGVEGLEAALKAKGATYSLPDELFHGLEDAPTRFAVGPKTETTATLKPVLFRGAKLLSIRNESGHQRF